MSVFTALFRTYEKCESAGLVGKIRENEATLLRIYHSNMKSGGQDIVEVVLDPKGQPVRMRYVEKDQRIVFPITEDSITRSGKIPPPHPLSDKFSYFYPKYDNPKYDERSKQLDEWIEFEKTSKVKEFLVLIRNFIQTQDLVECIKKFLLQGYPTQVTENGTLEYYDPADSKMKKYEMDPEKIFLTFSIEKWEGAKTESVSEYQELQQSYIRYVEYQLQKKSSDYCVVSGEEMYCSSKHRGLMGNAKIIGTSNHKQYYMGRITNGDDVVKIGYRTSQKIHLMLKYLLEHEGTRRKVGDGQYLLTWFSDDVQNDQQIDLTKKFDEEFEEDWGTEDLKTFFSPSNHGTLRLGGYVFGTESQIEADSKFYVLLLDKTSNGRICIKYFREFPKSDFLDNLRWWHQSCQWLFYSIKDQKQCLNTPSIFQIVDGLFGVERDGKLVMDNDGLRKALIENLIPCLIERKAFPKGYAKKMFQNVCNIQRYPKTGKQILFLGCTIIKASKYADWEVEKLLNMEVQSRSYLFGRLLAVFDLLERATFSIEENGRETNAYKFWSRYCEMPMKTAAMIREKLNPYIKKLNVNHPNYLRRYEMEMAEIFIGLERYIEDKNDRLDEDFVLGYYAERSKFFSKRDADVEKNSEIQDVLSEKGEDNHE